MRAVAQASNYRILICLLSQPAWLRVLRGFMGAARRWTPVLRTGPVSLALSHAHTVALLEQADDFHVTAGLSDRLPAGSFLMDIDWAGQHAAEKAAVEVGLGAECGDEVKALRAFAQDQCNKFINDAKGGPLNVARDFSEKLILDVVHEYFGIGDDEEDTRFDLRRIFRLLASQIFQSAPVGSPLALATLKAQDDLLRITLNTENPGPDTVLGRLQAEVARLRHEAKAQGRVVEWATDDWAARNVAALAAFGSGTVARAATQIVYRLLTLNGADRAATEAVEAHDSGDKGRVLQVAMKVLRFNPMLPLMGVRQSTRRSELYAMCPHRRVRVDPGQTFIPSPFAAMHDRRVFPCPGRFRTEQRNLADYLHFGHGRHICVGKHVAEALLEEIVIALFRRKKLKPIKCRQKIEYDGPAVERYEVTFDA